MFSAEMMHPRHAINSSDAGDIKPLIDDEELLLVDDDGPFRRSLSRALERRGFAVLKAETLKEYASGEARG